MTRPTIENHSNTWLSLKEYYTARLDQLRRQNDNPKSIEETERLRGQIAEIKHLLNLENTAGD
jgi:hypothetical protein